MALVLTGIVKKLCTKSLEEKFLALTINGIAAITIRERQLNIPRLRHPTWFTKKEPNIAHRKEENVTWDNQDFIKEVVQDRFLNKSTDQSKELITNVEWTPKLQRTGLIARKIGIYPLWLKNGKKISTTLLQILDNHVIKYYPPESYNPPRKRIEKIYNRKGCLLLGVEGADPTQFTRDYCGLFKDSGVIPKKTLGRFFVSPEAALPPGTLLNAMHFQVGNYVDVRGKTKYRGFQGVMKRHGFKGMPASHGVTKTHRRGGNIGGGGEKGRVWPGTKMPGHMGNRYRILRALKIWRINTKYNVLYVSGQNIPGETNSLVYVFDSKVITRRPTEPVPFPSYLGDVSELPEDIYDQEIHQFSEPSIIFTPPTISTKRAK